MVEVYTSKEYFKGMDGVYFVDEFFNLNVTDVSMLGERDLEYLKSIEDAEPISGRILRGRFGECLLDDISSGVKTLLILSLISQGKLPRPAYLNVTECGENVLPLAFKHAEELQLPCILRHICIAFVPDFEYRVNNEQIVDTTEDLLDIITEKIGDRDA